VSNWLATKAKRVLAALQRIGWRVKRQVGSHKMLVRDGWLNYEFSSMMETSSSARFSAALRSILGFDQRISKKRYSNKNRGVAVGGGSSPGAPTGCS
jgi:hypothetical protein